MADRLLKNWLKENGSLLKVSRYAASRDIPAYIGKWMLIINLCGWSPVLVLLSATSGGSAQHVIFVLLKLASILACLPALAFSILDLHIIPAIHLSVCHLCNNYKSAPVSFLHSLIVPLIRTHFIKEEHMLKIRHSGPVLKNTI